MITYIRKYLNYKILAVILGSCWLGGCSGINNADLAQDPDGQRELIESMYLEYKEDFSAVADVRPAELVDSYDSGEIVFVDVRTPEEQAVSMIPGAITKEAFEEDRGKYAEKRIVVHCTIGYRSGVYVSELAERGIKAENMVGSLLLWAHEGLPLEDADGKPTTRVHVYGKQWNLLPEGYEGVW